MGGGGGRGWGGHSCAGRGRLVHSTETRVGSVVPESTWERPVANVSLVFDRAAARKLKDRKTLTDLTNRGPAAGRQGLSLSYSHCSKAAKAEKGPYTAGSRSV